ncbi:cation:proton antiporter domain-containing protein [Streptosporangium soli]|nr:cation:proton antiporter [Streptosporangium sp. KLBMP 9127]
MLDTVGHFFISIVVVLSCAHLAGSLAQRLGQPRVVGEIAAGLALGPSLLGKINPDLAGWLLPDEVGPMIDGLAQLGLVLFMFGVGQELATTRIRGTAKQGLLISQTSMAVPFVAGALVAVPLIGGFAGPAGNPVAFVLFVGCAISITAFPVLARLISDLDLGRTVPARLSLFAAAVGDGASWLLLAVALAVASGSGAGGLLLSVAGALAVTLAFVGPVRTTLARWAHRDAIATGSVLPVVAVAATATLTAVIGIHQLIGALLVGIAWPARSQGATALMETSKSVLLPFFFLSFGLTVDLSALKLDGPTVIALVVLLLVAVVAKVAGPGLCGRLTGLSWRDSFILGSLLNARGLTELVVLQIGYQAGLIDQRLLAILTIVALATTLMTTPLLRLVGVRPPVTHQRVATVRPPIPAEAPAG